MSADEQGAALICTELGAWYRVQCPVFSIPVFPFPPSALPSLHASPRQLLGAPRLVLQGSFCTEILVLSNLFSISYQNLIGDGETAQQFVALAAFAENPKF